jgi:hypothetical protein
MKHDISKFKVDKGTVVLDNSKIRCLKFLRERPLTRFHCYYNRIKRFNYGSDKCYGKENNKIKDISYSVDYYDEFMMHDNHGWDTKNQYLIYVVYTEIDTTEPE